MSNISPFPAQAPLVDPQTGRLTREGLRFLNDMFARVGGTYGLSTTDVDAGSFAAMQPLVQDGCFSDITQQGFCASDQAAEPMQAVACGGYFADVMQADTTQPIQFWSP